MAKPIISADSHITEPPGTVIRSRQISIAALSASAATPFDAWQVLYASTDVNDQPNVAVATSLVLYEMFNQRRLAPSPRRDLNTGV